MQRALDVFYLVICPLIPSWLLFRCLPSKAVVTGPLKGFKINISGAFAAYFIVAVFVATMVIQPSSSEERHELEKRANEAETKLKETNAEKDRLAKLVDDAKANSTSSRLEEAQNKYQITEAARQKLQAELESLTTKVNSQTAVLWTVQAQIHYKGGRDTADYRDVNISLRPSPNIDRQGIFRIPIVQTWGATGEPEFPLLHIETSGYEAVDVRLHDDHVQKFYKQHADENHHFITVDDLVMLEKSTPYAPQLQAAGEVKATLTH